MVDEFLINLEQQVSAEKIRAIRVVMKNLLEIFKKRDNKTVQNLRSDKEVQEKLTFSSAFSKYVIKYSKINHGPTKTTNQSVRKIKLIIKYV